MQDYFAAAIRKTNLLSGLPNVVHGLDSTSESITACCALPHTYSS